MLHNNEGGVLLLNKKKIEIFFEVLLCLNIYLNDSDCIGIANSHFDREWHHIPAFYTFFSVFTHCAGYITRTKEISVHLFFNQWHVTRILAIEKIVKRVYSLNDSNAHN